MDLYKEMIAEILQKKLLQQICENLNVEHILKMECYRALKEIKECLEDEPLDDAGCFMKIEEIVSIFEDMGSDGGSRHDFG